MSKLIASLLPHQVFIYGANSTGFSCSGSAGAAIRGIKQSRVPWRQDPWVMRALKAPVRDPARIGVWGVFGIARGFSKGHSGMSYAIETIRHPGHKRSTPLSEIQDQIVELCVFCDEHPNWDFLYTEIGSGLAGYTTDEMAECTKQALLRAGGAPPNLVIPDDLYGCFGWDRLGRALPQNCLEPLENGQDCVE